MVSSSRIRLLVFFLQAIVAEDLVPLYIFMLTAFCKIYFSIFSFYSWGTNTEKAVFGRPSGGTQLQHHNYQAVQFQKSD